MIVDEFEPARADAAFLVKRGETVTFEADLFTRQGVGSVESGSPFVATGMTVLMTISRIEPPHSGVYLREVLDASGSVDGTVTNRVRCTVTLPTTNFPNGDHRLEWNVGGVLFPAGNKYMRVVVGERLSQA